MRLCFPAMLDLINIRPGIYLAKKRTDATMLGVLVRLVTVAGGWWFRSHSLILSVHHFSLTNTHNTLLFGVFGGLVLVRVCVAVSIVLSLSLSHCFPRRHLRDCPDWMENFAVRSRAGMKLSPCPTAQ